MIVLKTVVVAQNKYEYQIINSKQYENAYTIFILIFKFKHKAI